jgi:hypothetical protein
MTVLPSQLGGKERRPRNRVISRGAHDRECKARLGGEPSALLRANQEMGGVVRGQFLMQTPCPRLAGLRGGHEQFPVVALSTCEYF